MKEEKLKALIKKGKLETSPDFTDKLLQQVALQQKQNKTTVWPFRLVFGGTVTLISVWSYFFFTSYDVLAPLQNISMGTIKKPMLFVVFAALFFGLNHMIRLHEIHKDHRKDVTVS